MSPGVAPWQPRLSSSLKATTRVCAQACHQGSHDTCAGLNLHLHANCLFFSCSGSDVWRLMMKISYTSQRLADTQSHAAQQDTTQTCQSLVQQVCLSISQSLSLRNGLPACSNCAVRGRFSRPGLAHMQQAPCSCVKAPHAPNLKRGMSVQAQAVPHLLAKALTPVAIPWKSSDLLDVAGEGQLQLSRGQIPDLHRAICRPRDEPLVARLHRHRPHPSAQNNALQVPLLHFVVSGLFLGPAGAAGWGGRQDCRHGMLEPRTAPLLCCMIEPKVRCTLPGRALTT